MAKLGYFRTVPDTRFRFVKPGNNVDDMGTPANAVIFDSDADEFLQVLFSGTYVANSGLVYSKIVSWPDLGFIPFAWMGFRPSYGGTYQNFIPIALSPSDNAGHAYVNNDGIYAQFDGFANFGDGIWPVYLDYIIFRKHA